MTTELTELGVPCSPYHESLERCLPLTWLIVRWAWPRPERSLNDGHLRPLPLVQETSGCFCLFVYVRDTTFQATATAFSTVSLNFSSLPYLLETVLTHGLSVSDFQFLPLWSESDLIELSAWCALWRLLLSTPFLFSFSLQLLIHQFS